MVVHISFVAATVGANKIRTSYYITAAPVEHGIVVGDDPVRPQQLLDCAVGARKHDVGSAGSQNDLQHQEA